MNYIPYPQPATVVISDKCEILNYYFFHSWGQEPKKGKWVFFRSEKKVILVWCHSTNKF